MLAIDHASHVYTWNGRPVPSVTQILDHGGYGADIPNTVAADVACEFGDHVHTATSLVDHKCCVVPRLREIAVLRHYATFLASHRPAYTAIEQPVYSKRLRVAGTPDRYGWMFGHPFVLDIKTGAPSPFHGVQLAGYDLLDPMKGGRRRRRFVLYLDTSGYSLIECSTVTDYNAFVSLVEDFHGTHHTRTGH